jgi:hypothetical protein
VTISLDRLDEQQSTRQRVVGQLVAGQWISLNVPTSEGYAFSIAGSATAHSITAAGSGVSGYTGYLGFEAGTSPRDTLTFGAAAQEAATPGIATLSLTGYAPTVLVTEAPTAVVGLFEAGTSPRDTLTFGAAAQEAATSGITALSLTGYAPTVLVTEALTAVVALKAIRRPTPLIELMDPASDASTARQLVPAVLYSSFEAELQSLASNIPYSDEDQVEDPLAAYISTQSQKHGSLVIHAVRSLLKSGRLTLNIVERLLHSIALLRTEPAAGAAAALLIEALRHNNTRVRNAVVSAMAIGSHPEVTAPALRMAAKSEEIVVIHSAMLQTAEQLEAWSQRRAAISKNRAQMLAAPSVG